MFPDRNLDLTIPDREAVGLADDAMDRLGGSGLLSNQLEKEKVTAAANAIAGTVRVTRSTVQSLQDADRKRYVFSDDVWKAERSNIEKVVVSDLAPYQTSYGNLALLRTNYDIVSVHFVEYLGDLESFFDPTKHLITREGLRQILSKERYTERLLVTYSKALSDQMAQLKSLSEKLRGSQNQAGISIGTKALPKPLRRVSGNAYNPPAGICKASRETVAGVPPQGSERSGYWRANDRSGSNPLDSNRRCRDLRL
jgi:hypothetical protein